MDLKTILGIAALAIGVLLILGPQLSSFISGIKNSSAGPKPIFDDPPLTTVDKSTSQIDCLVGLAKSMEDKEAADYLVNKIGPDLIRKMLK